MLRFKMKWFVCKACHESFVFWSWMNHGEVGGVHHRPGHAYDGELDLADLCLESSSQIPKSMREREFIFCLDSYSLQALETIPNHDISIS